MPGDWERRISSWTVAGVIDLETARRIREYELARVAGERTRWSVWLALLFGAVLLGAGVLLLVSVSWDQVSPLVRVGLVVAMVMFFHVAAAIASVWSKRTALVLHVAGSVALGPGIFLAGSILSLDAHWPAAVMLWALGGGAAWLVRRDTAHVALVAVLAPAWLLSEWAAVGETMDLRASVVGQAGAFLLALAYLTTRLSGSEPALERRRALWWLGVIAFLPAAITLGVQAGFRVSPPVWQGGGQALPPVPAALDLVAWIAALALPLAVATVLRGRGAWANLAAACWVVVLALLPTGGSRMLLYGWLALGAVGLAGWGIRDVRTERINLGVSCFALVVLFFYFDNLMGKMGRSASLIALGLLFLVGGYALERVRRRMVATAGGGVS